jgi:hypothetical protein
MRCKRVLRKLVAFSLDELAPPDRVEIQAHLTACARCREAEGALRRTAGELRDLPAEDGSPERRARAVASMRRGTAERLARPPWERAVQVLFGRRRVAVVLLFAASLLVVVSRLLPIRMPGAAPMGLASESILGGVTIERAPQAGSEPLVPGVRLPAGCVVRVGGDARAVFRASHGGSIECRGGTAFRWDPPAATSGDVLLTLYYGTLWCDLAPLPRGRCVIRDVHDNRLTVVGTRFEVSK